MEDFEERHSSSQPIFQNEAHQKSAERLRHAIRTGTLSGSTDPVDIYSNIPFAIIRTLPVKPLLLQLLWSSIITAVAYFLSPSTITNTFTTDFWLSRINVPSSLNFGVGWALFFLLSFLLRQSVNRHRSAYLLLHRIGTTTRRLVRTIRQNYDRGSWHDGDHERMFSHLIAYPIALKMSLRKEHLKRDPKQLDYLLGGDDLKDVLASDVMHLHCMRVVRSYVAVAEDDSEGFERNNIVKETGAGNGIRKVISAVMDDVDRSAVSIVRISEFIPSEAYINHLGIFLYIWLLFLPLSLLESSGWFTIILSLLVTYCVAMLFDISHALTDPFGNDPQDVRLNSLCSQISHEIMIDCLSAKTETEHLVQDTQEDSNPLLQPPQHSPKNTETTRAKEFFKKLYNHNRLSLYISLFIFSVWTTGVVLFIYFMTRNDIRGNAVRWWDYYIPVSGATLGYISTIISVLVGFWLDDAYGRYRECLELLHVQIKPTLEELAFTLSLMCRKGLWHPNDKRRLMSYIAALPYALKHELRDEGTKQLEDDLNGVLNKKDFNTLMHENGNGMTAHVLDVINAYINHADKNIVYGNISITYTFGATLLQTELFMNGLENAISDCFALNRFGVSKSLSLHLCAAVGIWLFLLPLIFVIHDGWLSFIYVLPSAYCILYLLQVGFELNNPFKYDYDGGDAIPLDSICHQIHKSVTDTHNDIEKLGTSYYINPTSKYSRQKFMAHGSIDYNGGGDDNDDDYKMMRVGTWVALGLKRVPKLTVWVMILTIIWNTFAVCLSFVFSKTVWNDDRQDECRFWCSPIDVDGITLGNLGLTLFLILAYRSFDSVSRYSQGANIIHELRSQLTNMSSDIIQGFSDNLIHANDKERITAHLIQIPLQFRRFILGQEEAQEREGLLSKYDLDVFERSENKLDHLLKTVQAYFITTKLPGREDTYIERESVVGFNLSFLVLIRMNRIRGLIANAYSMKLYPFVKGYRLHQQIFISFWLALLPLSMTSESGFLTIVWSSLIAYGVLALEELAARLYNPFTGSFSDVLPVDMLCKQTVTNILEGLRKFEWDINDQIQTSEIYEKDSCFGTTLKGDKCYDMFKLPSLLSANREFQQVHGTWRIKQSWISHLVYSVPWSSLQLLSTYTALACVLSYITRDQSDGEERWWLSNISIPPSATTYLSFIAFTLLGFYSRTAFQRYSLAGDIWNDRLRWVLHNLVTEFRFYWDENSIHQGDHIRLIGFMASIPYTLKAELRMSRNIIECKGLLSTCDYSKLQQSESMTRYCISMVKSYYLKVMLRTGDTKFDNVDGVNGGRLGLAIRGDVMDLERLVDDVLFLSMFDVPAGFTNLLDVWLGLWFLLLPFILAELSGWFTIIWVPLIAFAILGTTSVAKQIQHPFGSAANGLDLDSMAHNIVNDIISTYHTHSKGTRGLLISDDYKAQRQHCTIWDEKCSEVGHTKLFPEPADLSQFGVFRHRVKLGLQAMSVYNGIGVLTLASLGITIAYFVGKNFSFGSSLTCDPWFCTPLAIPGEAKQFVGFALFSLLSFLTANSHERYENAIRIWQDELIGFIRLFSNRYFASFTPDNIHPNDLQRIAGHLSAFPISLLCKLRGNLPGVTADVLRRVLASEDDVQRILNSPQPSDVCIDVIRAYLFEAEKLGENVSCSGNELTRLIFQLRSLSASGPDCTFLKYVQIPFGYLFHIKLFMVIWIVILPLGLVEETGWLSIVWVFVIAYGILGVFHWADELKDPFGLDVSDVQLELFCNRAVDTVKTNLLLFQNGLDPYIIKDRRGFPLIHDSQGADGSDPFGYAQLANDMV